MSSEETLSESRVRGRVEEVENRDLRVPSNILEREDGRESCFNPEEEVVSEVAGYETTLENRGSLAHLVENYGVPGRVLVRSAGSRERACSAPGDHWMPLYSHYLAAGLRFPLPDLLVWLLLEYGLGLTQLTPNAMRLVVAFAVYSRSRGVSFPTASVFKYFYVLNAGSGKEKGWWKDKFFFADDTEWDKTDAEVEHLSRWKAKGLNLNEYSLTPGELEDVLELERGGKDEQVFGRSWWGWNSKEGKREERRGQEAGGGGFTASNRSGNLAITQPGHVGGEVTVAEERPIVAKRRRLERQEAMEEVEEVPEPMTSPLHLEGTSSASAAEFAAVLREKGYIRAQTTSFYDSEMRSTAKRFINTYFPVVDRQRAKDEVAARGSVGVVRQTITKERNQMRKDNAELVKKNEEAEAEVARLKAEMEELRKENATFKKDSEISYQKRKICEAELEKREKELEDAERTVAELEDAERTVAELELKVHNSVEEHVEGFLRSSTFEDIVNLYRLPTAIVAFSDCRKKVEEDEESSTADFHPEITLKWERDSRGQTILPPKFSFEFVVVEEERTEGGEVTEGAEKPAEGADQPSQPADKPKQPAASPSQTVD
ncbi:hypothetical protein SLEP1_g47272 [Rubroshorea leprosula]|uniref:Transposase (putative) gypsy type domain-containing protein n=1 Tax=Rubroshorea leprosula TaxID=152421 RepID=A0AAV5LPZ8_9ROSI|nr:hypothetical protein SLEP1_g47272 [Rubroshorea leprosula]